MSTNASSSPAEGVRSGSYEDWPITDLQQRAAQLGLTAIEGLRKEDLINLIRNRT